MAQGVGALVAALLWTLGAAPLCEAAGGPFRVPVPPVDVVVLLPCSGTPSQDLIALREAVRYVERGPHDRVDAQLSLFRYDQYNPRPVPNACGVPGGKRWTGDSEEIVSLIVSTSRNGTDDESRCGCEPDPRPEPHRFGYRGVSTASALNALASVIEWGWRGYTHGDGDPAVPGSVEAWRRGRRFDSHLHVMAATVPERSLDSAPSGAASDLGETIDTAAQDLRDVVWDSTMVTLAVFVDVTDAAARGAIGDATIEDSYRNGDALSLRGTIDLYERHNVDQENAHVYLLSKGCEARVLASGSRPAPFALFSGRGLWDHGQVSAWDTDPGLVASLADCAPGNVRSPHYGCVALNATAAESHTEMLRSLWGVDAMDPTGEDILSVNSGGDWHGKGIYALDIEQGLFSEDELRAAASPEAPGLLLTSDTGTVRSGRRNPLPGTAGKNGGGGGKYYHGDTFAGEPDPVDPSLPKGAARVPVEMWHPKRKFEAQRLLDRDQPVILRNSVVSTWAALEKWKDPAYLGARLMGDNGSPNLAGVKVGAGNPFFDPDADTPMSRFPTLNASKVPYTRRNITGVEMARRMLGGSHPGSNGTGAASSDDELFYYFGEVGLDLLDDIRPYSALFATDDDLKARKQIIWLSSGRPHHANRTSTVDDSSSSSGGGDGGVGDIDRGGVLIDDAASGGVEMHTHFDQDENVYVQLVGRKRFVLFPREDHRRMALFPRISPMWHKSSVPLRQRARSLHGDQGYPAYHEAIPYVADLEPGDVLIVPRMVFHNTKLLDDSPSISMATWNHDWPLRRSLFMVYRRRRPWEDLTDPLARRYALRLYLDLMVHEIVGKNQTSAWAGSLLRERYRSVMHLFPSAADDPSICPGDRVPGNPGVFSATREGVREQDAPRFKQLPAPIRDVLFADFAEEMAAEVVGAEYVPAFLNYCFRPGQGYVTDKAGRLADWGEWNER